MLLSVVIPAYNESDHLPETLDIYYECLAREKIPHELLVVNDNSGDDTLPVLEILQQTIPTLTHITNNHKITTGAGWKPLKDVDIIFGDIFNWIRKEEKKLKPVLGRY